MSIPSNLVPTRLALHALAERVISPVRVLATGNEIALEVRPGGFGTPLLPDGGWAGVVGAEVVRDGRTAPITTLRAAAIHVGLPDAEALPDEPLTVDAHAAARLTEALAAGATALAALAAADEDASPVRLWPEHFDVAIELGNEAAGRRAAYGLSPGDGQHDEPYAYVAPWVAPPEAEPWTATGFRGAELRWTPDADLLAFWLDCRAALER